MVGVNGIAHKTPFLNTFSFWGGQGVYSVDCHPTMSKVAIGSGDGTVRYLPRLIPKP